MAELLNIVRQRLGRASGAVMQAHPDADLMTGFLERSLTTAEQQAILQHLAQCRECRDVAVTALPEVDAAQPVLGPAPKAAGWRSLVLVRWGAMAAAAVIAVGTLMMYRGEDTAGQPKVAQTRTVQAPAQTAATAPAATSAPSATTAADTTSEKQAAAKESETQKLAKADAATSNQPVVVADAKPAESKKLESRSFEAKEKAEARRQSDAAAQPLAKTAKVRENEVTRPVTVENGFMASTGSRADGASGAQPNFPTFDRMAPAANTVTVQAETSPVASNKATSDLSLQARGEQSETAQLGSARSPLTWKSGALRRGSSLASAPAAAAPANEVASNSDAGGADPNLGGSLGLAKSNPRKFSVPRVLPNLTVGAMGFQAGGLNGGPRSGVPVSRTQWTTADGHVQRSDDAGASWKTVDVGENVSFHAIAHSGSQLWAGGGNGALFHSPDDGATWHRVTMTAGERAPKGDIISVDFVERQRLRVVTSAGEIWSSSDHGQHWDVQ